MSSQIISYLEDLTKGWIIQCARGTRPKMIETVDLDALNQVIGQYLSGQNDHQYFYASPVSQWIIQPEAGQKPEFFGPTQFSSLCDRIAASLAGAAQSVPAPEVSPFDQGNAAVSGLNMHGTPKLEDAAGTSDLDMVITQEGDHPHAMPLRPRDVSTDPEIPEEDEFETLLRRLAISQDDTTHAAREPEPHAGEIALTFDNSIVTDARPDEEAPAFAPDVEISDTGEEARIFNQAEVRPDKTALHDTPMPAPAAGIYPSQIRASFRDEGVLAFTGEEPLYFSRRHIRNSA